MQLYPQEHIMKVNNIIGWDCVACSCCRGKSCWHSHALWHIPDYINKQICELDPKLLYAQFVVSIPMHETKQRVMRWVIYMYNSIIFRWKKQVSYNQLIHVVKLLHICHNIMSVQLITVEQWLNSRYTICISVIITSINADNGFSW